jgi:exodeoxyribonuclease VII large subunit
MQKTSHDIKGMKLSELGREIKNILDHAFDKLNFWVIAEISNHVFKAKKNYHFFQLVEKDPDSNVIIAKMDAKAWGLVQEASWLLRKLQVKNSQTD